MLDILADSNNHEKYTIFLSRLHENLTKSFLFFLASCTIENKVHYRKNVLGNSLTSHSKALVKNLKLQNMLTCWLHSSEISQTSKMVMEIAEKRPFKESTDKK